MRRSFSLLVTITAAILLIAAPVSAKGVSASATGSGHVTIAGELRTFSFTAKTQDGVSSGQAEINNRNQDTRSHIVIDCLVVSGNRAFASGTISDSTNPGLVGLVTSFLVIDNGEGSNAPADQATLFWYPFGPCTDAGVQAFLLTVTFPIELGNVQVR